MDSSVYTVNKVLVFCIAAFTISIIVTSDSRMVPIMIIYRDECSTIQMPIGPKGTTGDAIEQFCKISMGRAPNDRVTVHFTLDGLTVELKSDRIHSYAKLSRGCLYADYNIY